jgi:phospholipid/cholesterol/gamma-HCH transport system substrate-binding protein
MIQRRTRVQLAVFLLITLLGTTFVGARYAGLGQLVFNDSYAVVAHFADSGGIFQGAEVSYRGVSVGRVSNMTLTAKGVDVTLDITNHALKIPSLTRAVVADRSAVGEQYVDLQPETDRAPYLHNGSQIPQQMTSTPISTTKLLTDLDTTVNSVNQKSLTTTLNELGAAFQGSGPAMGRLIDSSSSFIKAANDNFDITTALLQDGNTVLSTQMDKASDIRSFARDLSLVSDTLAGSDLDLRRIIENGSATANQLRTFLEQNKVPLGDLINNLVTTGDITARHIAGTRMILIAYPYVVAGGYTVVARDSSTGLLDAHFGLILQQSPSVCHNGYSGTDRRGPYDTGNRPMNMNARCTEAQSATNARGAQWAPRRAPAAYRAPVLGSYDRSTGTFRYADAGDQVTYTGGAAALMGEQSWKWLLLGPLSGGRG